MQPQQPTYREYVAHFSYLANKLHIQADQYKIGDRLIEAIQLGELKQAEREVIQECYAAHRNLDKFFGNTRSTNTTNLSVEKTLAINDILKKAGCTHLFDTTFDSQCEIMKEEEVGDWNLINKFIAAANENDRRRANLFTDMAFHDAVATTISNIESITNTALNQRCKYKRLHLRHAALTMCTKDFSKLLLMKPGELPEPVLGCVGKTARRRVG